MCMKSEANNTATNQGATSARNHEEATMATTTSRVRTLSDVRSMARGLFADCANVSGACWVLECGLRVYVGRGDPDRVMLEEDARAAGLVD